MAAKLQVLALHGVGDHHSNPAWKGDWTAAIQRAVGTWDPSMQVDVDLPVYDDLFEDARYRLDPERYAQAMFQLTASGITVGVQSVEEKVGQAISGIESTFAGFFHTGRGLADVPDLLRWTAGMVVQWADYDDLRKSTRTWLAKQLAVKTYDLILAHSLGTLVSYDTFTRNQALLSDGQTFTAFGSQIGNPFVRSEFGGYLVPLTGMRQWYQLFNPGDRAFAARIRIPTDHKFQRIETPFNDGSLGHDAVMYLSHPNAVAGMWYDVVTNKAKSRAFGPIGKADQAFNATLTTSARDRGKPVIGGDYKPNRRALLVGINNYPDAQNRLEGCVNDVFLVSAELQESGFTPDDIRVVLDERATTQGIFDRLHWLLDGTRDGDERVLFYSGHGAQIPGYGPSLEVDHLKECLVPYDFDWKEEHAITDTQFADLYSQLPFKSRFVCILDCCHAGGISRDGGAKVRGVTPPDDIRHRMLQWNADDEMWVSRKFDSITTDRNVTSTETRRRAYVGLSGASYRLGRGVGLRKLDLAKKAAQRRILKSDGPFMPLMIEACGEQELAYEYRHGVTSYGAFTFSLTKELREARHRRVGPKMNFDQLIRRTTSRLHRLQYDQSPCMTGPASVRRSFIPSNKPSHAKMG